MLLQISKKIKIEERQHFPHFYFGLLNNLFQGFGLDRCYVTLPRQLSTHLLVLRSLLLYLIQLSLNFLALLQVLHVFLNF